MMSHLPNETMNMSYHCPLCGVPLGAEPVLRICAVSCYECGYPLWCRKRMVGDVAVLSVLAGNSPEQGDIERLAQSLVRSGRAPSVVVDLSRLDTIRSSLMAWLILLERRLDAARGKLVLCGLTPVVCEVFRRTRIENLFEIVDSTTEALSTLNSGKGHTQINAAEGQKPHASKGLHPLQVRLAARRTDSEDPDPARRGLPANFADEQDGSPFALWMAQSYKPGRDRCTNAFLFNRR